MANYKLGVYTRNNGRIIDLSRITKIKELDKLDDLTSTFNSEEELKIYLFNQGLITSEEIKQNISVMYNYGGKVKKLPIFYSDMKKYLDEINLKYELNGLKSDTKFLEKLARHYSLGSDSFNPQGLNVQDIRIYLSDVRNNGGEIFFSNMLETAINDLFHKAVYKIDKKTTGEVKVNYRGLRDLALFIYKYKDSLKKEKEAKEEIKKDVDEWVQTSIFETPQVTPEFNPEEADFNEPDFPPNSEEEREFSTYLEEINEKAFSEPIEEHDHYRR